MENPLLCFALSTNALHDKNKLSPVFAATKKKKETLFAGRKLLGYFCLSTFHNLGIFVVLPLQGLAPSWAEQVQTAKGFKKFICITLIFF